MSGVDLLQNSKMLLKRGPRREPGSLAGVEYAYFDVDNTLVSNESSALPSVRFIDAARAAEGKIKKAVVSARPFAKVEHIINKIGADGVSILSNGAQLYDGKQQKIVAEWPLEVETCNDLVAVLQEMDIPYWINDGGVDHFPPVTQAGEVDYKKQIDIWDRNSELVQVPGYKPSKPFVIVAYDMTEAQASALNDRIDSMGDKSMASFIAHQISQPNGTFAYDVFIVNAQANKENAFREALRLQDLTPEQVMVVGDGRNDEGIISAAGVGVAMGNAAKETKNVATRITTIQAEDGAAVALEAVLQSKE